MSVVCEHVTANYQAIPLREPGQVKVRCPCCGLTAWREPDDDLDGDDCPYCYVQSELDSLAETPPLPHDWSAA